MSSDRESTRSDGITSLRHTAEQSRDHSAPRGSAHRDPSTSVDPQQRPAQSAIDEPVIIASGNRDDQISAQPSRLSFASSGGHSAASNLYRSDIDRVPEPRSRPYLADTSGINQLPEEETGHVGARTFSAEEMVGLREEYNCFVDMIASSESVLHDAIISTERLKTALRRLNAAREGLPPSLKKLFGEPDTRAKGKAHELGNNRAHDAAAANAATEAQRAALDERHDDGPDAGADV